MPKKQPEYIYPTLPKDAVRLGIHPPTTPDGQGVFLDGKFTPYPGTLAEGLANDVWAGEVSRGVGILGVLGFVETVGLSCVAFAASTGVAIGSEIANKPQGLLLSLIPLLVQCGISLTTILMTIKGFKGQSEHVKQAQEKANILNSVYPNGENPYNPLPDSFTTRRRWTGASTARTAAGCLADVAVGGVAAAGGVVGGIIGSAVPFIGTAVGAAVGTAAGVAVSYGTSAFFLHKRYSPTVEAFRQKRRERKMNRRGIQAIS